MASRVASSENESCIELHRLVKVRWHSHRPVFSVSRMIMRWEDTLESKDVLLRQDHVVNLQGARLDG